MKKRISQRRLCGGTLHRYAIWNNCFVTHSFYDLRMVGSNSVFKYALLTRTPCTVWVIQFNDGAIIIWQCRARVWTDLEERLLATALSFRRLEVFHLCISQHNAHDMGQHTLYASSAHWVGLNAPMLCWLWPIIWCNRRSASEPNNAMRRRVHLRRSEDT